MSIGTVIAGVALRALAHAGELEQEFIDEYNAIAHGEGGIEKVKNIIAGLTHIIGTISGAADANPTGPSAQAVAAADVMPTLPQ